jgi:hypothetical protein
MVLKSRENYVGARAFLFGVILAIVIGVSTSSLIPAEQILKYSSPLYAILVILGLIIGFTTNIEGKNSQTFLLAGAIIVIVSRFGMESVTGSLIGIGIGATVVSIFSALLVMFVPATIIVAIKTVYLLARV